MKVAELYGSDYFVGFYHLSTTVISLASVYTILIAENISK